MMNKLNFVGLEESERVRVSAFQGSSLPAADLTAEMERLNAQRRGPMDDSFIQFPSRGIGRPVEFFF